MMFPNLTTADQYRNILLHMDNTIMHEPILNRNRTVNKRRLELSAKRDATFREGVQRFGRIAFMAKSAFCSKCGKELRNKFSGPMEGILYEGCENFNPEMHCHRGRC